MVKENPFDALAREMRPQFSAFKKFLHEQASSFRPEVREAAKGSIKSEGKFIRPLLVFAASSGGDFEMAKVVRLAAIVELIHLSTLIHDDVIDDASMRRNRITANKKYGAKTAVLLGDAIFSHTILLALQDGDAEALNKIACCVRTVCEGEIGQTLAAKSKYVTRKRYYNTAFGKTGALFSLACALGAMSINAGGGWVAAAENAGKQLGIAYQIYDDVCDWFMKEEDAGKTLGTDLLTGKQTFPLIVLMENLPRREAKELALRASDADPLGIAQKMRELRVPEICLREFLRRISGVEGVLAKYPRTAGGLLKFCSAMRTLKMV